LLFLNTFVFSRRISMADTPHTPENQVAAPEQTAPSAEPIFQIQRVYLKEASLEQPNSPGIFLEQEQPAVDIQLGVDAKPVVEGVFECTVSATVTTKVGTKTMFLAECRQAGIFEIRNMPADQIGPILGIACPQIVYPYLRANMADLITRAGFPPVHLAELNFQAMYDSQQAQAQAEGDAA
jgi:preprotein translocase subunit SecB